MHFICIGKVNLNPFMLKVEKMGKHAFKILRWHYIMHKYITRTMHERLKSHRFGVFIVNFEQNFTHCSCVSIVHFEQVNANWVGRYLDSKIEYKFGKK